MKGTCIEGSNASGVHRVCCSHFHPWLGSRRTEQKILSPILFAPRTCVLLLLVRHVRPTLEGSQIPLIHPLTGSPRWCCLLAAYLQTPGKNLVRTHPGLAQL